MGKIRKFIDDVDGFEFEYSLEPLYNNGCYHVNIFGLNLSDTAHTYQAVLDVMDLHPSIPIISDNVSPQLFTD